jgi:D-tagatose-1,6-bisphosphate aldolase subunit GatZ/KbaZ
MGCKDEPDHLEDALTAERAARLVAVAERAASSMLAPRYVIGTEVPTPGGAPHEIRALQVTSPDAVLATLEAHRQAFSVHGAPAAFDRVIAIVAQPGVEFDNNNVVVYRPELARELRGALTKMSGLVFEAHSTDYQPAGCLANLVRDGFSVLKVGPGLTFAMREALYGLDSIAAALDPGWREQSLMATMEHEMISDPDHWNAHYAGEPSWQRVLRHFSYSDRIRYYWHSPVAQEAVQRLFKQLGGQDIPLTLISQFLPTHYQRMADANSSVTPRALVIEAVRDVLRTYSAACGPATLTESSATDQ